MRGTSRIDSGPASCGAVLHGCRTTAKSRREVVNLIRQAVVLRIGAMEAEGFSVPELRPTSHCIEVAA